MTALQNPVNGWIELPDGYTALHIGTEVTIYSNEAPYDCIYDGPSKTILHLAAAMGFYAIEALKAADNAQPAAQPQGAVDVEDVDYVTVHLEQIREAANRLNGQTSYTLSKIMARCDDALTRARAYQSGQPAAVPAEWLPIESAPLTGEIVNVTARYPEAIAGFPMYASFREGKWWSFGKHQPLEVIPWAWRPRGDWPMEPSAPAQNVGAV